MAKLRPIHENRWNALFSRYFVLPRSACKGFSFFGGKLYLVYIFQENNIIGIVFDVVMVLICRFADIFVFVFFLQSELGYAFKVIFKQPQNINNIKSKSNNQTNETKLNEKQQQHMKTECVCVWMFKF